MANFKTIIHHAVLVLIMLLAAPVNAVTNLEDAIETDAMRITLRDDNTGFIQGKICDYCKELTIAITAETRAFADRVEVPLKQAADRAGKSATIFINTEHTRVTRIAW